MIKLIYNEIIKLVKKKSFYIVTFIFILFSILTNIVYNMPLEDEKAESINIETLEDENKSLDLSNSEDLLIYVDNLTKIAIEQLKNKYTSNIQEYLINHFLYNQIYQMYENKYILNDKELYEEYKVTLEDLKEYVENEDWQYFLNERISYLEARINNTKGIEQEKYEQLLLLAKYRSINNVSYDKDNYLHNSLEFLEENMTEYINLLNDEDLTIEEENRLEFLKEEMSIHEYVIKNKQDVLNEHTLRAVLSNFSGEFGLFILIYVIMIAGSIVSEEYARGTIKSLFTKPFKRRTILSAKLFTVLLSIPVIMIFMSVIEIMIGGIILGFNSLSIPIIIYHGGTLESYSVFSYLFSLLFSSLPMYLVIGIFAFMLSTITTSTSAAITISFLFYLLANVISNLAVIYDLTIFKGCVSLYWNFNYLVLKETSPFNVSVVSSILIILVYILIMLCITYVTFGKRDVKNI